MTVTDIRYTYVCVPSQQLRIHGLWNPYPSYYKESHKILGNTYGMLVLQDFEAITPNLVARTIETVEGGGLVVLLLKTMSSLKQLYTMTMVRPTDRYTGQYLYISTGCPLSLPYSGP